MRAHMHHALAAQPQTLRPAGRPESRRCRTPWHCSSSCMLQQQLPLALHTGGVRRGVARPVIPTVIPANARPHPHTARTCTAPIGMQASS
jgi:hypothetical protein